ncbi:MAG: hypothetical protein KDJ17_07150 [Hyphomicrobiaceae bacterium]|nr:hypothetical protein [Hyphomicrobiaceae bacterium]
MGYLDQFVAMHLRKDESGRTLFFAAKKPRIVPDEPTAAHLSRQIKLAYGVLLTLVIGGAISQLPYAWYIQLAAAIGIGLLGNLYLIFLGRNLERTSFPVNKDGFGAAAREDAKRQAAALGKRWILFYIITSLLFVVTGLAGILLSSDGEKATLILAVVFFGFCLAHSIVLWRFNRMV